MIHSLSLPTFTYICMGQLSHFHPGRLRPFSTLSRFILLQVDQVSSVPLAMCSFRMIPLSRHSVDRSQRAFHSSTHNVVRTTRWKAVLGGRWPWNGCLSVSGHLLGGSDLRCWQPFGVCGEGLSPPVHTSR